MNYSSLSIHKANQELTLLILTQKEVFSQLVLIGSRSLFKKKKKCIIYLSSGCSGSLKLWVGFLAALGP